MTAALVNQKEIRRAKATNCYVKLVTIPAGKVLLGAPKKLVSIDRFRISETAITQRQWRIVSKWSKVKRELNPRPSFFSGDDLPVEQVSWQDAMEFCARLTEHKGIKYSLPSEAQWEYACRAGTRGDFNFGDSFSPDLVNCDTRHSYKGSSEGEFKNETVPVRSFDPNQWGLYEMHGNVYEWCLDDWLGDQVEIPGDGSANAAPIASSKGAHVVKGGGWHSLPGECRSAARKGVLSFPDGCSDVGFRVVAIW